MSDKIAELSQEGMWDWHDARGFRRIVNVSGTMTALGGSVTGQAARDAMAGAMRHFVDMHQLQARASRSIAGLTGAEAGFLTASASAGISLAIAGCMTGTDPARIEALPADPGPRSTVAVQLGHLCGYGAPIETAIALAGATPRPIGQATHVADYQLAGALDESVAAGLYIVSHHVVSYGQIPLPRFVEICHAAGVPVIVDAASEYDLTGFLAAGADLVIYSSHKFLGGPTGGIVAGRRDLVRAAYMQNLGIGRGMKIGKESIAGIIATLDEWASRDHDAIRKTEMSVLEHWRDAISDIEGVDPVIVRDPTGNPLSRLQVNIDPARAGATAATLVRVFAGQDPALIVRDHEAELGYFQLDPCNLLPGQEILVADMLRDVLTRAARFETEPGDSDRARNAGAAGYMSWLA